MPQYHPNEHPGILQQQTPSDLGDRKELLVQKHVSYIQSFSQKSDLDWEVVASDHFRMSGVYWALATLELLSEPKDTFRPEADIVSWIQRCYKGDGSFAPNEMHDGNLLCTLSAVQLMTMYGRLEEVDGNAIASWDAWGEVDTRYSYCALHTCALLGRLDAVDVDAAVDYVMSCQNFDGAFGVAPGCESHTGQVFCCVGVLSIAGALHRLDRDKLAQWLSERQTLSGGLQGRPEKLQDVCYSWWALSALSIISRAHWIEQDMLTSFILSAQDEHGGGISDRPDDMVDVFHTFFGIAALSLMGYPGLQKIDPTYALPVDRLATLSLPGRA